MNLVLIGFRATGKSSVGAILAKKIGWPFVDTDTLVEHRAGRSITEIFRDDGEAAFRTLEAETVRKAATADRTVIAAAAGSVIDPANGAALAANSYLIHLRASVGEIERRMQGDSPLRPALTGFDPSEEIQRLLAARNEQYEALADTTIETDGKTVAAVADEIEQIVRGLPAFGGGEST